MISKSIVFILYYVFTVIYTSIAQSLTTEGIVSTLKASDDEILYQASMIVIGQKDDDVVAPCAAAIVDPNHLVSIASCFTDEFGKQLRRWYTAKVGAKNLKDKSVKHHQVAAIYIPENYDWETSDNNIAVIKLKNSLNILAYNHLKNIDLPLRGSTYDKSVAILSAYGHHLINVRSGRGSTHTGTRDWHLRYLPVKVIDNAKCRKSHNSVMDSQLCGLGLPELKDQPVGACVGDLGGPLMFDNMLIGVLSKFQPYCVDTNEPAVYTRVSSVQPFIKSILSGQVPKNTRIDVDLSLSRS